MLRKNLIKILYLILIYFYFFNKKILKNNKNINNKIVEYNNKFVMYRMEKLKEIKNIDDIKVLLLLPHCVQNGDCNIRISNNFNNCIKCGKCNVGGLARLQQKFKNLEIKIATGGTVARSYIKEIKPNLIMAVACERDLLSGIFDAAPLPVYGFFNKILCKECVGTDFNIQGIEKVLLKICSIKEEK